MSNSNLNAEKAVAFEKIQDILFNLPVENDLDRAVHILDVLEQLTSRIIASSSLKQEDVDQLCSQTMVNIQMMASQFLAEEFPNQAK